MAFEQDFDLGLVTAYAYAVSKGYTGTEEEFAELIASYATVAEEAAASAAAAADRADDAAGSATSASGSASTATTKASEAASSAAAAAGSATTASTKAGEAAASATAAAGSATTASQQATAAAGSATTAGTKATEAAASATSAASSKTAAQAAQTAAETAQGKAEDAQEAAEAAAEQAEETLNSYAKVDGSYSSMTVGNAEQLVATVAVEDSVPYNFRTSGGTADIGDREVDKLVGGTIAWNQLVTTKPFVSEYTKNGLTFTPNNNGTISVAGTFNGGNQFFYHGGSADVISGHKYYVCGNTTKFGFSTYSALVAINIPSKNGVIAVANSTGTATFYCRSDDALQADEVVNSVIVPQIFDLTQMFGTTIADYIYSLETATPGAGVAWFRKLFPKPYYAYNPGELMSVQAAAHKMVGFNQLDEATAFNALGDITKDGDHWTGTVAKWIAATTGTGKSGWANIRYLEKTVYYCAAKVRLSASGTTNVKIRAFYTDGTVEESGSSSIVAQGNTGITYLRTNGAKTVENIQFTYGGGTSGVLDVYWMNINLSWDGERDGEYEPYQEWNYPLDTDLTLRGIPRLDSGNGLYYDGDTYESDGTVTRRYGVVDLGTLTWSMSSDSAGDYFRANKLSDVVAVVSGVLPKALCARYIISLSSNVYDKSLAFSVESGSSGPIYVRDTSYSDAATFKAAMSGVMLVYELATPTAETADPFQSPQIVDDFGTEEYVDAAVAAETRDVAIPVGHNTFYQANLRAKLEMSPDSPDGDGDYIVRQTNGQNAYVPLMKELPTAPTTEGTYHLKATVTSGGVTLTWEADT